MFIWELLEGSVEALLDGLGGVIFMLNPTTVEVNMRLCCPPVGVVTINALS